MTKTCAVCGGTYAPVQADGTRYFHVCPADRDDKTGVATTKKGAVNENALTDAQLRAKLGVAAVDQSIDTLKKLAVLAETATQG